MVHALLLLPLATPAQSGEITPSDAIVIRADEARQSEHGNTMHFQGNLQLIAADWQLEADVGRLHGRPEDPDLIVVEGRPAVIKVDAVDGDEDFVGYGQHIEFEPRHNAVRLSGKASVVSHRQSIISEHIEYQLDDETFNAGAGGRVRVVTTPR